MGAGPSKRDPTWVTGKADSNKWVSFPSYRLPTLDGTGAVRLSGMPPQPGDYVAVLVTDASKGWLKGEARGLMSIPDFHRHFRS